MIWSELNSICAGIGGCGMPDSSARSAGRTRSGSRRPWPASGRRRPGAPTATRAAAATRRNSTSPTPARLQRALFGAVARIDLVELARAAGSALTLAVIRHGIGTPALGSSPRARRASARRRSAAARCRRPARHRDRSTSARWPGSMLRWTRVPLPSGALAGRDAERIARAGGRKLPSPRTEPASERTSPLKAMSFSSSVAAAGGIMQRDAAGEVQPVDRKRAQIERAGRGRPVDPALGHRGRGRAPCR